MRRVSLQAVSEPLERLAKQLRFGPAAFERLRRKVQPPESEPRRDVPQMVLASVPQAAQMRGERGQIGVTRMLANCYAQGVP